MAKTYYDVSSRYIMDQISGISGFLVIQTDTEREARLKQIAQDQGGNDTPGFQYSDTPDGTAILQWCSSTPKSHNLLVFQQLILFKICPVRFPRKF